MSDRDMSEPKPTTPAEARKRIKERDDKEPGWKKKHYRDDLTVTDEVPRKGEE